MESDFQGNSIDERLAWHEAEEARLRKLAASCLRQAEEHAAKAAAFRLVAQDLDLPLEKSYGEPTATSHEESSPGPGPAAATPAPKPRAQKVVATPRSDGRPFIAWIREAVRSQPETFDLMDVRQVLDAIAPGLMASTTDRNAITKALTRMVESQEIYVVRKGQGKRPAIYGK